MLKASPNLHNAYVWRGMRVGLLGGSFNPPHDGHLHISRAALRLLKLDAIWWLVSPGNPLKDAHSYAPLPQRLKNSQQLLMNEPRMLATDIEDALGTHRTIDSVRALKGCFPLTDFVFLMGSDNAQTFHKWHNWRDIADQVTLGVLARPPAAANTRNSPLRMDKHFRHISLSRAEPILLQSRLCIWMEQIPLHEQSSTRIRNAAKSGVYPIILK